MESDFESILNAALNHFDIEHNLESTPITTPEEPEIIEDEDLTEEELAETSQLEVIDNSRSRFSGASWFDKFDSLGITLAGLGGIGSWTAIHLGRLNPKQIDMYDPDYIEEVNLAGQHFSSSMIGQDKTQALQTQLSGYSRYFYSHSYTTRFTDGHYPREIFICGFDNMESRKVAYNTWKSRWANVSDNVSAVFIDARLSAEKLQIFTIGANDTYCQDKYEKEWLFADNEAEETVCSYKQTSFCAAIIGGLIVNSLINYVDNFYRGVNLRNQPFMISYDAMTMYLKTFD